MSASPASPAPFAGLRVLDFGVGAVGVEVGRFFAEYGADVVKVESATAPDFIRTITPEGMNPAFASSSRSKRGLGVNLKDARGLTLVRRLARLADVVVENNGAGVMERLGLGYADLRVENPRLVYFSSNLTGSRGPWSGWIGYGPSTHPVSGMQHLWNFPEDETRPAGSTNIYPDHFVGRLGALAAVAGLFQRERTGRGYHAEAAQFEGAIGFIGDLLARESLAPGSVHPRGNASERGAPWGAYPCAGEDEWCAICVRSDAEWCSLRQILDAPEWAAAPDLDTASGRIAARETLDRHLSVWTKARTPHAIMHALQARGIPAVALQHPAHEIADPHLIARGYPQTFDQPPLGRITAEGPAFRASDLPGPIQRPAPMLGQHTREVCRDWLGLEDGEIDVLFAGGVLEEPTRPAS
jgi:crotonobetainyl-CoA:carnitine CoA-transferase CaiB-like acyl-CoA transferase